MQIPTGPKRILHKAPENKCKKTNFSSIISVYWSEVWIITEKLSQIYWQACR